MPNVAIALAAVTASPLTKARAVGPTNSWSSSAVPARSVARLASRFLTTRNVASASASLRAQLGGLRDR